MKVGWQFAPPITAVLAFVFLSVLYLSGATSAYSAILEWWMVSWDNPPFRDMGSLAAAMECERAGYQTYLENPCDPTERMFVYTPFWKLAAALPIGYSDTAWLAIGLIILFLCALFLLPKVETPGGSILMALAMISPATAMAVQYGNNEMLIFVLVVCGAILLGKEYRFRAAAYAIFVLSALLKYFPAIALATALRERASRLAIVAATSLIALAIFAMVAWEELPLSLANIYTMSPFAYLFGIKNIDALLGYVEGFEYAYILAIRMALIAAMIVIAFRLSRSESVRSAVSGLPKKHRNFFLVGALLIVGAYFTAQNVAYRQIYMLMVIPALLYMRQRQSDAMLRFLPILSVILMFDYTLRMNARALFEEFSVGWRMTSTIGLVLREQGWIILIIFLLAIVLATIRQQGAFANFRRVLHPAVDQ